MYLTFLEPDKNSYVSLEVEGPPGSRLLAGGPSDILSSSFGLWAGISGPLKVRAFFGKWGIFFLNWVFFKNGAFFVV